MKSHLSRWLACASLSLMIVASSVEARQTDDVSAMIAERFAGDAGDIGFNPNPNALDQRQSLALFELARSLNPREVRYQRGVASAALSLGESDVAVDALQAIRRLAPDDQLAQIRLVDLLSDRMETIDQRVRYLEQVLSAAAVPAPVRSHAATLLYDLRVERGEENAALAALDRAIELNPVNTAARRIRYQRALNAGNEDASLDALAELLRANPVDSRGLAELARAASASGRHETAARFIELALTASAADGVDVGLNAIDYFAALALAGQNQTVASQLAAMVGTGAPDPQALWLLDLVLRRLQTPAEQLRPVTERTRQLLVARLAVVSRGIRGEPDAESLEQLVMPDVEADIRVLTSGGVDLRDAYVSALTELAMFDLYRDTDPDPVVLKAISTIRGPDHPSVTMLEGWKALRLGLVDDARLRLNAAAQTLPLAQALLIGMDARSSAPDAAAKAQALIEQSPQGVESMLIERLLAPATIERKPLASAAKVDALVDRINPSIALATGDPRRIWQLRIKPQSSAYNFGQPMLAELSLTNRSSSPIGIGATSLIKPLVLVDANVRGMGAPLTGYTGVDLWGPVVLGPNQSMSLTFRVDVGRLRMMLTQAPVQSLGISLIATANPIVTGGTIVAGMGGQSSLAGAMIERRATVLQDPARRESLLARLATGTPAERLSAGELLARVAAVLRAQPDNADAQKLASELTESLVSAVRNERDARIRAFLRAFESIARSDRDQALQTVDELLASDDAIPQALGVMLLRGAPGEIRTQRLEGMAQRSAHPAVAQLASAVRELPEPVPAAAPGAR